MLAFFPMFVRRPCFEIADRFCQRFEAQLVQLIAATLDVANALKFDQL